MVHGILVNPNGSPHGTYPVLWYPESAIIRYFNDLLPWHQNVNEYNAICTSSIKKYVYQRTTLSRHRESSDETAASLLRISSIWASDHDMSCFV